MKLLNIGSEALEFAQIVASREQVFSELDGEAVILDMQSGTYYGLDPVGARVWQLIQQPKALSEIRNVLLAEYDVDPEICDRDLTALLNALQAEGLILVQDGNAA